MHMCIWRSEDNLQQLVLSFHHMGPMASAFTSEPYQYSSVNPSPPTVVVAVVFEAGFSAYLWPLAVLELTLYTTLALNSEQSTCLCLPECWH